MRTLNRPWAAVAAAFAALMFFAVPAAMAKPAGQKQAPGAQEGPLMKQLDLVTTALAKVDLNDDEKASTKQILADAEAQLVALRDEAKAGGAAKGDKDARQAIREKATKILKDTRDKLDAALTADQQKAFHQALRDARQEARGAGDKPATQPAN